MESREGLPRGFGRLAWSNLAAQSAEQVALAAAPIVAVLAFGADAGATGLLQTAQTLPYLLLSVPAGVLADRGSRRRLMAGAEALRALALAGVLTLAHAGLLTLPLLALCGFGAACCTLCATARRSSSGTRYCGRSSSRNWCSTPQPSCCKPCTCPTRSIGSASPHWASA